MCWNHQATITRLPQETTYGNAVFLSTAKQYYHIYKAGEFTCDCQEAAVTNTFKQELKVETLLYLPILKATTKHWILCIWNLLRMFIVRSFWCFCFVGYFPLSLKSTICNCHRLSCSILVHAMEADSTKTLSKLVIVLLWVVNKDYELSLGIQVTSSTW